jgi:malonyl CoA-acyl carrier protein transacylase
MMSIWLTTGQMIDQLEIGETAVSNDGMWKAAWKVEDKTLNFTDKFDDVYESVELKDKNRLWKINKK